MMELIWSIAGFVMIRAASLNFFDAGSAPAHNTDDAPYLRSHQHNSLVAFNEIGFALLASTLYQFSRLRTHSYLSRTCCHQIQFTSPNYLSIGLAMLLFWELAISQFLKANRRRN
jgi:hypothetical protein